LPVLISLSLLAGVVVSLVETQGAQADYYTGCGYGYSFNHVFGFGTGYGYGYDLNVHYGYGYGNTQCPIPTTTFGSGGGGSSAVASTTSTTTLTTTSTTTLATTTTTLRKKTRPHLLGLHVYFANDSAVITNYYKGLLNELAIEVIQDHVTHLTVIGYASSVGPLSINQPLSTLRAHTVQAYLESVFSAHGYSSISFTVSGNGVLRAFPNPALDRVVVITG
jgi:hypothetical protein